MTILDDLAAYAAAQRQPAVYEHVPRVECYISRLPVDWCLGCKRGWHKATQQPVRGSEPEEIVVAEVEPVEVTPMDVTPPVIEPPTVKLADLVRDPDYCPRCTPQGFASCRCEISASE